eukprot:jgi/Mesvir1/25790/Mv26347-RA.1
MDQATPVSKLMSREPYNLAVAATLPPHSKETMFREPQNEVTRRLRREQVLSPQVLSGMIMERGGWISLSSFW